MEETISRKFPKSSRTTIEFQLLEFSKTNYWSGVIYKINTGAGGGISPGIASPSQAQALKVKAGWNSSQLGLRAYFELDIKILSSFPSKNLSSSLV